MTGLHRFSLHAFVVSLAVLLSGYATIGKHLPAGSALRLGAVSAEALVYGEGGNVGDVSLGRLATIVKPVAAPAPATPSHSPIAIRVGDSDDLRAIAARYGVTVDQIRWSNAALTKSEQIQSGQTLVIPPLPGIVVTLQPGETLAAIGERFHVDPMAIADYNYLRDPSSVSAGTVLVVPGGEGPKLKSPIPGSTAANHFPWGWCTWYVASRVGIPWNGNAWEWYGAAQAYGYDVGQKPQPGSVMVSWDSFWYGHVAYVESVNPDGSFLISEMNYKGFGVVSQRTVVPGKGAPLIGFIYF